MIDRKKVEKKLVFVFPFVFVVGMCVLRIVYYPLYEVIGLEDGLVEWLQFFFYLVSGILAFQVALRSRMESRFVFVLYLLLALVLIFIAFEEISWGQRLFEDNSLSVFESNVQGESNLHNIEGVHGLIGYGYLGVCFYGCFSWLLSFVRIKRDLLKFLIVPPILIPYFVFLTINLLNPVWFAPQDYELVELILSMGVVLFLWYRLEGD
ncbi:hypothetical protein K8R14_03895 [bacterium]|nr:hypothetical protein [bacterium]